MACASSDSDDVHFVLQDSRKELRPGYYVMFFPSLSSRSLLRNTQRHAYNSLRLSL
jgi:hypothetical protein